MSINPPFSLICNSNNYTCSQLIPLGQSWKWVGISANCENLIPLFFFYREFLFIWVLANTSEIKLIASLCDSGHKIESLKSGWLIFSDAI